MNTQLVLVCEHHHNDLVFFRYDWPRQASVPPLLVLETRGEALAFLRKCAETYGPAPGLVICELNLPDGSGLDVLNYIKSIPALHDIPVVMTSERMNTVDCQQAMERGAIACWRKPITWEQLRPVLEPLAAERS